jgi:4-hydroxy-3-polyprenylbenzoate decarboxylase
MIIENSNLSDSLVVAITGASGIGYGLKLIEALTKYHKAPYLILSDSAEIVTKVETDYDLSKIKKLAKKVYSQENIAAEIASGSFKVGGMVVCPCSMKTLGLIAHGIEINLIVRSALCQLKEGRKLILVPRETPLSLPIIENMKQAFLAGAIILPAMPGFYHKPKTILELENFIVGKILDQFDINHDLFKRWGDKFPD